MKWSGMATAPSRNHRHQCRKQRRKWFDRRALFREEWQTTRILRILMIADSFGDVDGTRARTPQTLQIGAKMTRNVTEQEMKTANFHPGFFRLISQSMQ